jgi:hypothetical protein
VALDSPAMEDAAGGGAWTLLTGIRDSGTENSGQWVLDWS